MQQNVLHTDLFSLHKTHLTTTPGHNRSSGGEIFENFTVKLTVCWRRKRMVWITELANKYGLVWHKTGEIDKTKALKKALRFLILGNDAFRSDGNSKRLL